MDNHSRSKYLHHTWIEHLFTPNWYLRVMNFKGLFTLGIVDGCLTNAL
jgi:hypothetical protein